MKTTTRPNSIRLVLFVFLILGLIFIAGRAYSSHRLNSSLFLPILEKPNNPLDLNLPFDEYEAEDGETNGVILGPSREFGTFAAESSGRRSVRLENMGDYVEIEAHNAANSIVVRYAIPDAPAGGGIESTISVYVDGAYVKKLPLTSVYAWVYGGEAQTLNDPSAGGAHKFFDEVADFLDPFPAGTTVRLQKDPGDDADYIVVDLIDLEWVGPPGEQPAGYLSIESCGAIPDDGLDDGAAIQDCVNQARAQNTGVWIPVGFYHSLTDEIQISEVTVQGAGMWYSALVGPHARFQFIGNNSQLYDFSIVGEVVTRDDSHINHGFHGLPGSGTIIERVWVERTLTGLIVGSTPEIPTDGLIVRNSRFRTLFADGINVNGGSSNVIIENNHFRYTGDDALASWSSNHGTPSGTNRNNRFQNNVVQLPWRANCFAIYGGADNRIENNVCLDTITYPGIFLASQFESDPFSGTTIVRNNKLVRAGGPMWGNEYGALTLLADEADIAGFLIEDLTIEEPTFSGIRIESNGNPNQITDLRVDRVEINSAGTWGIDIRPNVGGEGVFANLIVRGSGRSGLFQEPSSTFSIKKEAGNSGW